MAATQIVERLSRPTRRDRLPPRRPNKQHGFTLIELMVALTVLLIGISGIVALNITATRATAYSRHATEAAVLAEDKMEQLRTVPIAGVIAGSEQIDDKGKVNANGLYTRSWTITWSPPLANLEVRVSWLERGSEPHSIGLRTVRMQ